MKRRASGGWHLTVTARTGHSAGVFGKDGYGAVYEAARVLNAFRDQLIEPDLTFNAATMVAGTSAKWDDGESQGQAFGKTNVIPRDAQVRGDLRYLTAEQGAKARERMQAIVGQALPGTRSACMNASAPRAWAKPARTRSPRTGADHSTPPRRSVTERNTSSPPWVRMRWPPSVACVQSAYPAWAAIVIVFHGTASAASRR